MYEKGGRGEGREREIGRTGWELGLDLDGSQSWAQGTLQVLELSLNVDARSLKDHETRLVNHLEMAKRLIAAEFLRTSGYLECRSLGNNFSREF